MDKTTAVLSRTNLGLRIFEQALTEAGVKYFLVGKSGYWSDSAVKSVLAYLGCVLYPADWLIAGAIRAPFWPSKFLPKQKLLANLKQAGGKAMNYWALLVGVPESMVDTKNLPALRDFVSFIHQLSRYKSLPPAKALKSVISALKAVEYYRVEEDHAADNDPVANLVELVKMAERYDTIKDFLDFTRRASAASKSKRGVALATIHSFKGAEADVVYVVGVSDGVLPHAKATDLEEEKNIWFVAASRPKSKLIVTYSGQPSPFLKDVVKCKVKESE